MVKEEGETAADKTTKIKQNKEQKQQSLLSKLQNNAEEQYQSIGKMNKKL